MTKQRRFSLGKAPFIRKADKEKGIGSTNVMMRDFIIALIPLILFNWYKNGILPYLNTNPAIKVSFLEMLYPLLFVLIGGLTTFLIEGLYYALFYKLKNKELLEKLSLSFAVIPGLILAMILPHNTPIWLLILGASFATIIGKLLFGGFGHNIFNPALLGYLFVTVAYFAVINNQGGFLNAAEMVELPDLVAGATPLGHFASNPHAPIEEIITPYGSLLDFFIGTTPGSGAETSALLCLVALIFLIARRVISWTIPVIYLVTVFVLSYIIGAFQGYGLDLSYPLFHLFSGGLMFGAVFMATEPVTAPRTPNGKVIYALGLGVLTVLFRFVGNFPEGVASAIITMNMLALIIDRLAAKVRVSDSRGQIALTYGVIALILVGISAYSVTKSLPKEKDILATPALTEVIEYEIQ